MRNSIFVLFLLGLLVLGVINLVTRNQLRITEIKCHERWMYVGSWGETKKYDLPRQWVYILKYKGKYAVMEHYEGSDELLIKGMGTVRIDTNTVAPVIYIKQNEKKVIEEAYWGKRISHHLYGDYQCYEASNESRWHGL